MILVYLETPLGVPVKYVLETLQDILRALTTASPDCPIVYLPSDCGEIWIFIDESKIRMEWWLWMVLHGFFLNGDLLFEFNMFGLLPCRLSFQNSSSWAINGMGVSHVIQQDWVVDYLVIT